MRASRKVPEGVIFATIYLLLGPGCGPYPDDPFEPPSLRGLTATKLSYSEPPTSNQLHSSVRYLTVELADGSVRYLKGLKDPESTPLPMLAGALQLVNPSDCGIMSDGTFQCNGSTLTTEVRMVSHVPYSYVDQWDTAGWCYVHLDGTVACRCGLTEAVVSLGNRKATQIAVADGAVCLLLADTTVSCWSLLAKPTRAGSCAPVIGAETTISGIVGATQIVGTGYRAGGCALVPGGQVRCWGKNQYGQLGNGTTTDSPTTAVPVLDDNNQPLLGVSVIDADDKHSCAILGDHSLRCWGYLDFLTNQDSRSTTATGVPKVDDLTTMSLGGLHSCGIHTDGSVICWGGLTGSAGLGRFPSLGL